MDDVLDAPQISIDFLIGLVLPVVGLALAIAILKSRDGWPTREDVMVRLAGLAAAVFVTALGTLTPYSVLTELGLQLSRLPNPMWWSIWLAGGSVFYARVAARTQ